MSSRDEFDGQVESPWVVSRPLLHRSTTALDRMPMAYCDYCECPCPPGILCWCCEVAELRSKVRDAWILGAVLGIVLGSLVALFAWTIL